MKTHADGKISNFRQFWHIKKEVTLDFFFLLLTYRLPMNIYPPIINVFNACANLIPEWYFPDCAFTEFTRFFRILCNFTVFGIFFCLYNTLEESLLESGANGIVSLLPLKFNFPRSNLLRFHPQTQVLRFWGPHLYYTCTCNIIHIVHNFSNWYFSSSTLSNHSSQPTTSSLFKYMMAKILHIRESWIT